MPDWDQLLRRKEYRWTDPHPSVVRLAGDLRRRGCSRILDLGCGAGRHAAYLSRRGFTVIGVDTAVSGLTHAAGWLAGEGLAFNLAKADMTALPARSGIFDCVVSIYVLHHNTIDRIRRAFSEIERLLVEGGMFLAIIQSRDDWKYGRGERLEPNTYVPDVGDEAGVPHHFFDESELTGLLDGFRIIRMDLERTDAPLPDGSIIPHRHWDLLAEKR